MYIIHAHAVTRQFAVVWTASDRFGSVTDDLASRSCTREPSTRLGRLETIIQDGIIARVQLKKHNAHYMGTRECAYRLRAKFVFPPSHHHGSGTFSTVPKRNYYTVFVVVVVVVVV